MLPDSPDVADVALGDDGILANAKDGLLYIDCSTIRPDTAVTVADAASAAGVRVLDAPVSGGEQGAIDGTLSIMVGGERAAFDDAAAVFDAVGKTVVHVGPAGSGQTVKAAHQLIVGAARALRAVTRQALLFVDSSTVAGGARSGRQTRAVRQHGDGPAVDLFPGDRDAEPGAFLRQSRCSGQ
jgi:2-hydroxy-3-oxopropionate reductase